MKNTFLIITTIATHEHPVLNLFAKEASKRDVPFIVIGDTKSPNEFELKGCDYYSIDRQKSLQFELAKALPLKHYARKNLGYLIAISKGAETIIETDDDNVPLEGFWDNRAKRVNAHLLNRKGWVNIYKYFTQAQIWPRGFALEKILNELPTLEKPLLIDCPIQQGLADENPDVDAIYRLTLPLPIKFNNSNSVALGNNSVCPFNSQNTTWFKEAFPLLYLPSYCSFRMTDIWRSFIAQRIAWECDWSILFHNSTVYQERNYHKYLKDFVDEIPGYLNNAYIVKKLTDLSLKKGKAHIVENMKECYRLLIDMNMVDSRELELLTAWDEDCSKVLSID